jgi:hypothetical protein
MIGLLTESYSSSVVEFPPTKAVDNQNQFGIKSSCIIANNFVIGS